MLIAVFRHLSIDIETYSSVDIKESGLYKYVQSDDFEILLFAYSMDGEDVKIIDLALGEQIPDDVIRFMLDSSILKHAYNAAFEWYCLSKYMKINPIPWLSQWRCTMLHGLYCGYTAGLGVTGEVLGLPQEKQKLTTGKALIRTFCTPHTPTNRNPTNRVLPHHEPEKWRLFKEYCVQDVVTEMEIERRLSAFPVPDQIQNEWELDQRINAAGVQLDMDLIDGALNISKSVTETLMQESRALTGSENPNSVSQLKDWVESQIGITVNSLDKETVKDLLAKPDLSLKVRRVLEIRQELGKSSVKKYDAMVNGVCKDGRIRGLLQFYGANRTGRWAGRFVQVQNLPRNYIEELDFARNLIKNQDKETIALAFGNVPDTLSQLIRTAFIPAEGHKFVVADFSAIEARVIAWLAGETWRQDVFRTHGKIYEASAAAMFGVPIEKIKKGNPEYALRAKGKVAELALGYQGGAGALINMGALKMGLSETELPDIVQRWRKSNPNIVRLWYQLDSAAVQAVRTCTPIGVNGCILRREGDFATGQDFLTVQLPSRRKLFYARPYIGKNRFDNDSLHYFGVSQTNKKWVDLETYGGKLTENIVQAIARDCLAVTLQRLEKAGYQTVMHIHDEAVIDCPKDRADLNAACELMRQPIPWADGLILNAAGFVGDYYRKD